MIKKIKELIPNIYFNQKQKKEKNKLSLYRKLKLY